MLVLPGTSRRDRAAFARTSAMALVAVAAGLVLARLPLGQGLALMAGGAAVILAAWEPAAGLGLALAIGPARAYVSVAFPGLPSDLGQVFFGVAVAGWLARGLAQRRIVVPHVPLLIPLGVYFGVGLVSLLGAISLEEGLKEALKWLEIGIGVVVLVAECARGRRWWVVAAVLGAGLAQAVAGFWQYGFQLSGPEHFRFGEHFRAYGTFEQPNPYGGFLGLIWPIAAGLALAYAHQWLLVRRPASLATAGAYAAAAALLLAGLYVSLSRGAWLGAAAAAGAMALALPRRWWAGLALAAVAAAALWALSRAGLVPASVTARLADVTSLGAVADVRGITITSANFAIVERLAHWQAAQAMARAHPWLGVGLGNYAAAYPAFDLLNWPQALGHAHNIYLNVLAETGMIGLAAYAALWLAVIGLTLRAIQRTRGLERGLALGLLGAWVHLSVHQIVDNLYVNNVHLTLAALAALLVDLDRRARPKRLALREHN